MTCNNCIIFFFSFSFNRIRRHKADSVYDQQTHHIRCVLHHVHANSRDISYTVAGHHDVFVLNDRPNWIHDSATDITTGTTIFRFL